MCGITGIYNFSQENSVNLQILKNMADSIYHRGPDGEGYYTNKNIGLAHRRLSIIDLSTGNQPMYNESNDIVVIFNGEIYNYKDLRQQLIKRGYIFSTTSDTEIIIHAYEEWGINCQSMFTGMWAFAIWDDNKKSLFLSRDRIGEKPIFYGRSKDSFIFGSEIKSLFASGFPREINQEIMELYLFLGYVPSPYTFYKNIFKLPQGHFIIINTSGCHEQKYWDIPDITEKDMITDSSFVYSEFERLFKDSLKMQIQSDVPYGIFLSGGLDSSSILAGISRFHHDPIQTVTIGFKEKSFDERLLARISAKTFASEHHEFVLEKDTFSNLTNNILFHFDEPFADPAAIPVGYISKLARSKIKMAMSGDGGDEALSGYNTYQSEKFVNIYNRLPYFLRGGAGGLLNKTESFIKGEMRYSFNRLKRIIDTFNETFNDRLILKFDQLNKNIIKKLIRFERISIEDYIENIFRKCRFCDPFYKLMWFHYKVLLPDRMLPKVDRMSMAYSLEVRSPFLDYRLLELMYKTHKNIKMPGFERKSVLKKTIGRYLPKSVLNASKRGFEVPLREWFRDDSYSKILKEITTKDIGFDLNIVKSIINDNTEGKYDYGLFIWKLILYYKFITNSH